MLFNFLCFVRLIELFSCRVVDDEILLTMDDGRSALKVLELNGKEVANVESPHLISLPRPLHNWLTHTPMKTLCKVLWFVSRRSDL